MAWLVLAPPARADSTCHGRFVNPITDICWSCIFPMTIGGTTLLSDGQEDTANPSSPVCYCSNPPRIGLTIGFWEPARLVDVTRTPFCMVGLGGIQLDPGVDVPRGAQVGHDSQRNAYQVHWYANPISLASSAARLPLSGEGSLDLVYLTEVDPVSRRRADRDSQPGGRILRQPARQGGMRRLRHRLPISTREPLWCAGCRARSTRWMDTSQPILAACRRQRCSSSEWPPRCIDNLRPGVRAETRGCAATTRNPSWTRPNTRCKWSTRCRIPKRTGEPAASHSGAVPSSGARGRTSRLRARTSPIRFFGRGTAVPALIDRLGISLIALCAALPAHAAEPAWPSKETVDHIRETHPFPDAEALGRAPIASPPKINPSAARTDIEALVRQHTGAMNPSRDQSPPSALRIFVTLERPAASLRVLADQAARSGATLVLRGSRDNSMRSTLARVQSLIGERKVAWQIDPQAFRSLCRRARSHLRPADDRRRHAGG